MSRVVRGVHLLLLAMVVTRILGNDCRFVGCCIVKAALMRLHSLVTKLLVFLRRQIMTRTGIEPILPVFTERVRQTVPLNRFNTFSDEKYQKDL